ncbi:hypothetical protein SCB71_16900 [Herbiconiux sp. KACC 21604]|uniref:hypothetical protein n=1 Tax=unclassified Herbiconiux TaxID=2618217 RepID=UPI0014931C50|nr:hypothetical protein [Herbiconiux sp. SALV-R1]QJU54774.1 hypothetical protein HL652_14855 [Herbiconiux sp. SALV-R1]WPO85883.1 hypothetical protein SCB71_16900 [Herbiconiux sp. KACC 21604]
MLARTDKSLFPLIHADRLRAIDQVAAVLARWRPELGATEHREWSLVVLAGIDGLTEGVLTGGDDQHLEAASVRLARSIAEGMRSS